MYVMRLVMTIGMLLLSLHAVAYDAARCAETRSNIAKLEGNLRRGAADSDRLAYQQSLSVYRKAEAFYCGSGPSASGPGASPRANSPAADAAALLGPLLGALQSVPLDAAAYLPTPSGPTLPPPPPPSGSVTGPMTLQRLGAAPSVRPPTVSANEPTIAEPNVNGPAPVIMQADARQTAVGPAVGTPTVRTPAVRTLEPNVASPFPTDQQINASCSSTRNPSMCNLVLQNQRNKDPAYIRFKAEESARMDRNIDSAMANVDAAIAARSAQNARPTIAIPVIATAHQTIPVAPPSIPYDNSDPDLTKCREGEDAPWTIAGCYDLASGPSARHAVPRPSLRDRLKKALDALPDTTARPSREADPEPEYDRQWQPAAEARLRDAIRNGASVVAENRQARAACTGAWVYDGLSEGECYDNSSRVVYAVNVPPQTQAQAPSAGNQTGNLEPFTMDPGETEREIRRMLRPLEPEQHGPPVPGAERQ